MPDKRKSATKEAGSSLKKAKHAHSPRVCVVGSSNMDLISYVPTFPRPGETVLGHKFQTGFGGKGANQCIMAAKLGGEVNMLSKVGKDMFGDSTKRNYSDHGVSSEFILTDEDEATGVAPIAVDKGGENTIIVVPGANFKITTSEVEAARSMITRAKVLLCQNEIPIACTLKALQIAKEAGVTAIFSAAPAPSKPSDFPPGLLEACDILIVNETELSTLAESDNLSRTPEALRKALEVVMKKGARQIIVTLGAQGCLYRSEKEDKLIPAYKVGKDKVVDTVGAGDCFAGSLGYYIASGFGVTEAISKASLVASMSIQKKGTQSSYPTAKEVIEYTKKMSKK